MRAEDIFRLSFEKKERSIEVFELLFFNTPLRFRLWVVYRRSGFIHFQQSDDISLFVEHQKRSHKGLDFLYIEMLDLCIEICLFSDMHQVFKIELLLFGPTDGEDRLFVHCSEVEVQNPTKRI